MKLLYLHDTPLSSQKANLLQVRSMCNALAEQGVDVTLSLPADGSSDSRNEPALAFQLDFRQPSWRNDKVDRYLNMRAINDAIERAQPDLCYLRSPLLLKQALTAGIPIIMELHEKRLHRFAWMDRWWKRRFPKMIRHDQVRKVICVSQALTDYWKSQGVPPEKLQTAHNAIDPELFGEPSDREEARKKLRLPADKKIVTYAGRLYKNRRVDNLLYLAEAYPDCLFLIVGGPFEESRTYQEKAKQMGLKNILLTGQVPHEQVPDYLHASDVLLALWSSDVPTIDHCSPLKLFEYMAAERILVVHSYPTIREVLTDGENAILIEPDSVEALITGTGKALSYSYPCDMARNARKEVLSRYTWSQRTRSILQGVTEALHEH